MYLGVGVTGAFLSRRYLQALSFHDDTPQHALSFCFGLATRDLAKHFHEEHGRRCSLARTCLQNAPRPPPLSPHEHTFAMKRSISRFFSIHIPTTPSAHTLLKIKISSLGRFSTHSDEAQLPRVGWGYRRRGLQSELHTDFTSTRRVVRSNHV